MGGGEYLLRGLVLGAENKPVFELFSKGVKVFGHVRLGAGDVKHHDGLLVVREGHIGDLARNVKRVTLAYEMPREPRLPVVSCGVGHPNNVPIVSGARDLI